MTASPITILLVLVACFFAYGLVSERLARTPLTAPILFTIVGILLAPVRPVILAAGLNPTIFLRSAEAGLVLLLFSDASRTDLRGLRRTGSLPARLLTVGLVLTILLGALAARLVFSELSLWEAGILAAILAPTDAGLGEVIVRSPRVPARIREALSVEAGLNDGLCVPFLLLFIALAAARVEGAGDLTQFIVEQLGYGLAIGAAAGLLGGWALGVAHRRHWMAESFQPIAVLALPLACLLASEQVGASMFIAAFVAGLTVQVGFARHVNDSVAFTWKWGQLLNLTVFLLFGIIAMGYWPRFGAAHCIYAILSLTAVRMLPVAAALIGTRLGCGTVLFVGWFGPRGLASIVLGLVYLEQEMRLPGESTIRLAVMVTVLLSIFAHGLSAQPGIQLYAGRPSRLKAAPPQGPKTHL
jgi:NhaP-type Na+/H+ or K+/H+ antiporter